MMRQHLNIMVGAFGGLVLCASTQAIVPGPSVSRYSEIPARNLFGLKPLEPAAQPTNPPVPLPKLTLTGITTILGNKLALMKMQPVAGKAGAPANELSLILAQGQREDDIEVLKIDENGGRVQVNNSGTPMTLTFEKDGAKTPTTAGPPAPLPPSPGSAALGIPPPVPVSVPANTTPGMRTLPSRNVRSSRVGVGANPYAAPAPSVTPGFGVSVPNVPPAPPAASALPPDLTPEEQMIVLELRRQAEKSNSGFPSLPANNSAAGTAPGNGAAPAIPAVPNTLLPAAGTTVPGNTAPLLPQ